MILLAIAAIANALMDATAHGLRWTLPPTHFFGKQSWRRKYKNHDPAQGPAFPLSTTALVFLTDGWHLCKTIMLLAIFIAGSEHWYQVLGLYVGWSIVFEISYRLLRG